MISLYHLSKRPLALISDAQKGFTLLEVLVAFVILSATLVLATRIQAGSAMAMQRAEESARAALLAQSQMAWLKTVALDGGSWQGKEKGLSWRAQAKLLPSQDEIAGMGLLEITLDIQGKRGYRFSTLTLRELGR